MNSNKEVKKLYDLMSNVTIGHSPVPNTQNQEPSTDELIKYVRAIAEMPNCIVGTPLTLELASRLQAYKDLVENVRSILDDDRGYEEECDIQSRRPEALQAIQDFEKK